MSKESAPIVGKYTLKAGKHETKPFDSYDQAVKFGQAWKGSFSIFNDIAVLKDGLFVEWIEPCDHEWQEDEAFKDGTVIVEFNGQQETRFKCISCGQVTFKKSKGLQA